jgi:hypothetical protein
VITKALCEELGIPTWKIGRTMIAYDVFGASLFDPKIKLDDLRGMLKTPPQKSKDPSPQICGQVLEIPPTSGKKCGDPSRKNAATPHRKNAALNNNNYQQPTHYSRARKRARRGKSLREFGKRGGGRRYQESSIFPREHL